MNTEGNNWILSAFCLSVCLQDRISRSIRCINAHLRGEKEEKENRTVFNSNCLCAFTCKEQKTKTLFA